MKWYFGVWKKYATFAGRARRKEYWTFCLLNLLFSFGIALVVGAISIFIYGGLLGNDGDEFQVGVVMGILADAAYTLAGLIPSVAVAVRRMHDTGRSGWWLFLPVINFILLFGDSQPSGNGYGANPKLGELGRSIAQVA